MNIYAEHCLDYLKAGYSVIPDNPKKKSPLIKKWNEFGKRFPTKEEVLKWGQEFQKSNIAVMLGQSSGIIAVDVDTENEEELAIINKLLTPSPCEKVGSKGYTRFYRYKGEHTQVLKNSEGVVLELLSTGNKTTIPPSIHPKIGSPYKWSGQSILDVQKDSLPVLPPHLISCIQLELDKLSLYKTKLDQPGEVKQKGGRHYFLGASVSQMIADRLDVTAAVLRLIDLDKNNHEKPLFTDNSEFRTDNAFINALSFYSDYLKSINAKRISEGSVPELPFFTPSKTLDDSLQNEEILLPTPSGVLKDIYDYIIKKSYVEQPVFALGAAISTIGTLASRKFTFQDATPNTYILNIADSGSGKDSCQQAIKQILTEVDARHLLGATKYPSEASITVNLDVNPVRLDIIDEASDFLQTATQGGAAYQTGIGDTLCELYSCSNSEYLGKVLASNQGNKIGMCKKPHLNLLCSTTYKGIADSLNRAALEKGLFARFMTFFGDNNKTGKRVKKSIRLNDATKDKLEKLNNFVNPLFEGDNKMAMPAYELKCSKEADILLDKYHKEFDLKRVKTSTDSVVRPVIARLFQQMMKIVLISAVANMELDDKLPKVEVRDVEFAYQYIKYFYQNIEKFIEENLFDSIRGKNFNLVLRAITDRGEEGINSADLTTATKSLSSRDRQEILRDLIASRQVEMENTNDPTIVLFKRVGKNG